ncbi:hypothetical protein EDD15DRAFT_2259924, partial [Pisolithus albus]
MSIPFSAPAFFAPALPSEEPDQVCAIWVQGIAVNITETMKLLFCVVSSPSTGYREQNLCTHAFSSPEEGEVVPFRTYLRIMPQSGQTNLSLDI